MSESLGARLRQQREEQQIALSTIVEQTKIKLSLLEALERDDISRWPGGIFGRAFVRAYAHAIGLQPDIVVREFLEQHPNQLEEVAPVESIAEVVSANVGPPTRFHHFFGAAVGSLSRLRPGTAQKHASQIDDRAPAGIGAPPPPMAPEAAVHTITAAEASVVAPVAASEPNLSAAAYLCTEFGRLEDTRDAAPLLQELARLLDAVGLIVWVWDPQAAALLPTLPCGYSDQVLAQLPNLPSDARNATAAAFRSGLMSVVSGGDAASDALVVPLMAPAGCAGVLAIELQHGGAGNQSIRALATIFAAQMVRLIGAVRPAAAAGRRLA